jgi:V/A-type H+-transporting ATPase subunit C
MSVNSVMTYSRAHATVRALYSTMLTPETWSALLAAEDFDAVLNTLSKTVYEPYLSIKRELLTPRRAVYQIRRHLADIFEKITQLLSEEGRQLLLWLWRLYEVDDIKAVLRGIESHADWQQVLMLLYPKPQHATLSLEDMQRMVTGGDIARAVEITRDTPYYSALEHALERYKAEGSLFPLEVALDLEHHRQLWQSIEQLSGLDHEKAMSIVGSMIDMDNLLWAIRYRVYHHLSEQEIINYTLPFGYKVRDADIRAVADGAEIAPLVKRIYPELGGLDVLERIEEEAGPALQMLEVTLQQRIVEVCRKVFIGNPFHIGIPIAYVVLNEYEIRDLTVLIEAKASRLPTEAFDSLLVFRPPAYQTTR